MAKSFKVDLPTDHRAWLARAKKKAKASDAQLDGDTESGKFSWGKFKGRYRTKDDVVVLTITDKPWWAPWSKVESGIKDFFA